MLGFQSSKVSLQFDHHCSAQGEQPGPEAGTSVDGVVMLIVMLLCDDVRFPGFVGSECIGEPEPRSKIP